MKETFFECPLKYDELPTYNGKYICDADHIEEASEGGDNSEENCQILCKECHFVKTKHMQPLKKQFTTREADMLGHSRKKATFNTDFNYHTSLNEFSYPIYKEDTLTPFSFIETIKNFFYFKK